jgi:hypothetical protein
MRFCYLRNVFKALSPSEYESLMRIVDIYPLLKIDRAYFKGIKDFFVFIDNQEESNNLTVLNSF